MSQKKTSPLVTSSQVSGSSQHSSVTNAAAIARAEAAKARAAFAEREMEAKCLPLKSTSPCCGPEPAVFHTLRIRLPVRDSLNSATSRPIPVLKSITSENEGLCATFQPPEVQTGNRKCRPETGSADPHQSAAIHVRTVISECTPPDPYPPTSCDTLQLREDTCTATRPATDTGSQKCRPHVRHHLYLKAPATASASINRIVWGIHSRSYFTHPSTAIPGSRHTLEALSSWTRTRPPYPSDPTTTLCTHTTQFSLWTRTQPPSISDTTATLVGECAHIDHTHFGDIQLREGRERNTDTLDVNQKCAPNHNLPRNKARTSYRCLTFNLTGAYLPRRSPCGPEPVRLHLNAGR
ncbi:hypothetical protein XELAEV_18029174mg [Xenopus laevis]|uniref:Uncharacterized protein n=1 Tax=Xenopus laevis TaxID=8355 RepID=A0A974CSW3_XENLA|nr:hypothetical protein XELAEV_18029174mg [Xenopus laevis]